MNQEVILYFDGMRKVCTVEVDHNGELVFSSADGHVLKLPNVPNLEDLIHNYNEANKKAPAF